MQKLSELKGKNLEYFILNVKKIPNLMHYGKYRCNLKIMRIYFMRDYEIDYTYMFEELSYFKFCLTKLKGYMDLEQIFTLICRRNSTLLLRIFVRLTGFKIDLTKAIYEGICYTRNPRKLTNFVESLLIQYKPLNISSTIINDMNLFEWAAICNMPEVMDLFMKYEKVEVNKERFNDCWSCIDLETLNTLLRIVPKEDVNVMELIKGSRDLYKLECICDIFEITPDIAEKIFSIYPRIDKDLEKRLIKIFLKEKDANVLFKKYRRTSYNSIYYIIKYDERNELELKPHYFENMTRNGESHMYKRNIKIVLMLHYKYNIDVGEELDFIYPKSYYREIYPNSLYNVSWWLDGNNKKLAWINTEYPHPSKYVKKWIPYKTQVSDWKERFILTIKL